MGVYLRGVTSKFFYAWKMMNYNKNYVFKKNNKYNILYDGIYATKLVCYQFGGVLAKTKKIKKNFIFIFLLKINILKH